MATEEIRELIGSGELAPGQRVNVDELAESLELSRTPIRDALQVLKTEGLVEIQPRVGVFVRKISRKEVEDVYSLKAAVEPMAAAWAAERGTDQDRTALTESLDLLRTAAADDDVRASAGHVEEIHSKIFAMAESEPVFEVYRILRGRVRLLRYLNMAQPGRLQASAEQHAAVVDAVVAGDAAAAREAMRQHMADAISSLRRVLVEADDMIAV